jgi:D-sedoheptulose 7-phosphate isomerase
LSYVKKVEEFNTAARRFLERKKTRLDAVIRLAGEALRSHKKILVFGNGGSAAQAQHFAAELVNKFQKTSPAFRAVALTTDTSVLTAIANDENYELVFSRQIEALGDRGDIALGLSTSGNSPAVTKGLEKAKRMGLCTVALTGQGGGKLATLADFLLDVPSASTPRIQEVHLLLLHLIAEGIEDMLTK